MNFPVLLAIASLAAGSVGASYLLGGSLLVAAACHLVSAGIGCYAAVLSDSRRLGGHWFQAALSFCIPFLGGSVAFFLSEAVKRKKTGTLSDEFAVYLNDAASFRESVPINDGNAPSPEDMVSLADILANPISEAEQRIAVENLISMESPAAMDILRQVIDADKGEGRFFAMTALGQMEEKLLSKLQGLEEDLTSGREDGVDILLETARTYMDFSYYQLAQDARRREYLERAEKLLDRALQDEDCPDEAWILLGRIKLLEYDGENALKCFDAFLRKNPGHQGGLIWRAEAWYLLGNYERVREDCGEALRIGPVPGNIGDAVRFWLHGKPMAPMSK